jgi:hypothetical protein
MLKYFQPGVKGEANRAPGPLLSLADPAEPPIRLEGQPPLLGSGLMDSASPEVDRFCEAETAESISRRGKVASFSGCAYAPRTRR